MDRLILLRHGKAEADAPSGRDFDRALTPRGQETGVETELRTGVALGIHAWGS